MPGDAEDWSLGDMQRDQSEIDEVVDSQWIRDEDDAKKIKARLEKAAAKRGMIIRIVPDNSGGLSGEKGFAVQVVRKGKK